VGRYAGSAWGVEIDRVKADKGNAFMRYAVQRLAARDAQWADFPLPHIRCAPIEEVWLHFALLVASARSPPTLASACSACNLEQGYLAFCTRTLPNSASACCACRLEP
jgi:hypothetical protein